VYRSEISQERSKGNIYPWRVAGNSGLKRASSRESRHIRGSSDRRSEAATGSAVNDDDGLGCQKGKLNFLLSAETEKECGSLLNRS